MILISTHTHSSLHHHHDPLYRPDHLIITPYNCKFCETTFKKRYANHQKSFKTLTYENETELSNEVLRLKKSNFIPQVSWKIVKKCSSYNRTNYKCNLCLSEKLEIALYKENNLLNSRSELISKCWHLNKHILLRHDSNDWRHSICTIR